MRIRISSEPEHANLPKVRSWFNVDKENTVASLKFSLCASVPALRDAHIRATELVLILDDFELLDDSPVHILRDGDLICLRLCTHLPKRRAEVLEDAPRKRHKPLPRANTAVDDGATVQGPGRNGILNRAPGRLGGGRSTQSSSSSTDSSSESSSSDTSSSNSKSTSTSESSSDSDSDSTSSDDHPPHPHPPLSVEPVRKQTPVAVPPGFGNPRTHARNERRRKKRLAERQDNTISPVPTGSSNAVPLGVAISVGPPEPMMMSLKNKNKRRGFKNTASMPSHITFQGNDVAPNPPPKLIPPSERYQLPPRLFVTSVDVEGDISPMNGEQVRDRKWKKTQRDSYGQEDEADIVLDYTGIPEEDSTAASSVPDYTALEKAWVNAPRLIEKAALPIGSVVGWQELGINPTTLTPGMMLFLARVVSSGESGAVVVRLRRPGLGMVSFAGGDLKDEEVEEEVEEFSWAQILEMSWQLVSK